MNKVIIEQLLYRCKALIVQILYLFDFDHFSLAFASVDSIK
jgi:hypothetical protein